jgi:acyl-CoA thioesterase-2
MEVGASAVMDTRVAEDKQDTTTGGDVSPREIVGLLTLEPLEVNMFRGHGLPGEASRLYGGLVAAQALAAAGCTVTGARPHSLHSYFLRPGDSSKPVLFQVDRLHDGRTFHRRRVTAIQIGEPILCLESSFTADMSDATDYQSAPPVPPPGECSEYTVGIREDGRFSPWSLVEARPVPGDGTPLPRVTAADFWFRFRAGAAAAAAGVMPEAMLTYLSDLTLAAATLRPTRRRPVGRPDVTRLTSLDHSVWFHNTADLSDWLLYAKATPATGAVRGLASGHFFSRGGTLVASVIQEALLHAGPGG